MATHSSTLAWKIPWMEERGRLQSTGLQRVGHDWATSLSFFHEGELLPPYDWESTKLKYSVVQTELTAVWTYIYIFKISIYLFGCFGS